MNVMDWAVVVGGVAAILWVNWYFFLAERSGASAASTEDAVRPGGQEGSESAENGADRSRLERNG